MTWSQYKTSDWADGHDVSIIIPARLESTRLPRKLLLDVCGKPLIQWTYERAASIGVPTYIATDSAEIALAVSSFGGRTIVTGPHHRNGTSRVAEAVRTLSSNIKYVINIQADTPEFCNDDIIRLIADVHGREIATLAIMNGVELKTIGSSVVKVVCDKAGYAMYFSRSNIPWIGDNTHMLLLRHIGIYAYKRSFLNDLTGDDCCLARTERLEQLNWLYDGHKIMVLETQYQDEYFRGIDTTEDLDEYRQRCARRFTKQAEVDKNVRTWRTGIPGIYGIYGIYGE